MAMGTGIINGVLLGTVSLVSLAAAAMAETAGNSDIEVVIVTGTRETTETQYTAISPVDVFSAETLQSTVSSKLDDTLAQLVPSFDVKRLPASDGPEFVRPATLNNLSPDMTLVLVNGKRFHRSAFLGSNGSQAMDLAQIPTFATGRVEVLRDGASAQYGSDAIAGVINIMLQDKPGYAVYAQGSQYYYGDGLQMQLGGRAGFELPNDGHAVLTVEYNKTNETSRTSQRPDAIAFQAANPTLKLPDPVQRWGNPDLQSIKAALDVAEPFAGGIEAYAFGTFSAGRGIADINWRNPATNTSVFKITSVFPGFDLKTVYPLGFTPHEGIDYIDTQAVAGIRQKTSDSFTWDVSGSYGVNNSGFFLNNTINASLGPDSPHNFKLGHMVETEFDLNFDAVYRLRLGFLPDAVNIAFGAEHRQETFQVKAGELASYEVGPGAASGLTSGSNGFPGFNDQQAGIWTQASYAGYVDIQTSLTQSWQVDVALRDESYSDFGNTFNYKASTRYEIVPGLALRGAYSTGFKAPTPGQLHSTSTSQGLDTVTLQVYTTGRLSPLNPVAQYFGAKPLKPEESKTVTAGLVWMTEFGLTGSVDLYKTDVTKRFSTSSTFTVTPAVLAQLVAEGVSGAESFTSINFFTNDFNTMTRGVDVTASYGLPLGPGEFNLTGAYSYNNTKVTSGTLAAASNNTQRILYQQGVPQHNVTATATYSLDPLSFTGRVRYYGPWTDSSGNSTGDIFQRFGGIAFVDFSVAYDFLPGMTVKAGAENLFNAYPEKATYQASRGIVYSRNSPFDTNGGNYYLRYEAKF
jgi:iron complex outermembrane recepter protein